MFPPHPIAEHRSWNPRKKRKLHSERLLTLYMLFPRHWMLMLVNSQKNSMYRRFHDDDYNHEGVDDND